MSAMNGALMTDLEQRLASAEGGEVRDALVKRLDAVALRLRIQASGTLPRDTFECHAAVMSALDYARQCLSTWPVGLVDATAPHPGLPVPASPQPPFISKEHLK
jgi:hypothetical protein